MALKRIFSFGYHGSSHEALRTFVQMHGAFVLDIRLSPTSMQHVWDKETLSTMLGSRYLHAPALGNVNYKRPDQPFLLQHQDAGLELAHTILMREGALLLLCSCRYYQTCHRTLVARLLEARVKQGGVSCFTTHLPSYPSDGSAARTLMALTLSPPWGTAIAWHNAAHGIGKHVETRSWHTDYRGPLAIHQASNLKPIGGQTGLDLLCQEAHFQRILELAQEAPDPVPLGQIVAVATLDGCVPTTDPVVWEWAPAGSDERALGDYSPGRYAWHLSHIERLPAPVPARGSLGLWPVATQTAMQVRAGLAERY